MSRIILILGKSGTGKSRSITTLPPKETVIINVLGKDLPFRGWKKNYQPWTKDNPKGNLIETDRHDKICSAYNAIAERKDIKYVVVDDFNYIMTNEFMRRSGEKGFDKWSEMADHAHAVIWNAKFLGRDQTVFFMAHTDTNEHGEIQTKTLGKLLQEKVCIEGLFTVVLTTLYDGGNYFFETQTNGLTPAKSPEGMFPELRIPNDLKYVVDHISKWEDGE